MFACRLSRLYSCATCSDLINGIGKKVRRYCFHVLDMMEVRGVLAVAKSLYWSPSERYRPYTGSQYVLSGTRSTLRAVMKGCSRKRLRFSTVWTAMQA